MNKIYASNIIKRSNSALNAAQMSCIIFKIYRNVYSPPASLKIK